MPTIRHAPQPDENVPERSLVIGATGLIGSFIVRELCARQMQVRALRRWNSEFRLLEAMGVPTVVGDILDRESLVKAMSGCNVVFFAAAPGPARSEAKILMDSVAGLRNVLEVGRDLGVEKTIVTSSASTLAAPGPRPERVDESCIYLPGTVKDPFVEAKYAIEQECYRYAADGVQIVILNPTLCVGPGVDLAPYAALAVDSETHVNYVDVRHVAVAQVNALERGLSAQRYLLSGVNTTVGDAFEGWGMMRRGKNRMAWSRLRGAEQPREAFLVRCDQWFDNTKARRELELPQTT